MVTLRSVFFGFFRCICNAPALTQKGVFNDICTKDRVSSFLEDYLEEDGGEMHGLLGRGSRSDTGILFALHG